MGKSVRKQALPDWAEPIDEKTSGNSLPDWAEPVTSSPSPAPEKKRPHLLLEAGAI